MRKALVCGAGGFIGGHLVKKLKREGYWVRGVDIKMHEYAPTQADEFLLLDLREPHHCWRALSLGRGETFDEVYQLAADMGGMGFIHTAECEIMHNSALINIHMIDTAARMGVPRYFFSSSVCVYRDMEPGEPALTEADAIPANPDNEYGWEKLYAERMAQAYARHYPLQVRMARFENCYGPEGTWRGGREKAPAALCRKVAEAAHNGEIEIWGDGKQTRSFLYIDECIEGVRRLMESNCTGPVNIGSEEMISINNLAFMIAGIAGKNITLRHIDGPLGVRGRNSDNRRIAEKLGWAPSRPLAEGIATTYKWIEAQVRSAAN